VAAPYVLLQMFLVFSSEFACSRLFRAVRWCGGVYCPNCGSRSIKSHGRYRCGLKRYFCRSCRRRFNDKTDTILHYPRLSIREWLPIHRGI